MGKNREQTNLEKNWLCAVDLSAFERTLKELIVSYRWLRSVRAKSSQLANGERYSPGVTWSPV